MSDNVQLANAFNVTRTGPMLAEIFGEFPCDADFLQDLDLTNANDLNVDDETTDYATEYAEGYVTQYSGVSGVGTQTSNMTDDWTQTDEEDAGYIGGGSQSPIGSYVENDYYLRSSTTSIPPMASICFEEMNFSTKYLRISLMYPCL
jgi:hypothetical protein